MANYCQVADLGGLRRLGIQGFPARLLFFRPLGDGVDEGAEHEQLIVPRERAQEVVWSSYRERRISPSLAKNRHRFRSCSDSPSLSWMPIRFRYSGCPGSARCGCS